MLKAVVDTNVLISAAIGPGKPREVLRALKQDSFHAFYPEQLIQELYRAPSKPSLAKRLSVEDISDIVKLLERKATLVKLDTIPRVSRDRQDDAFLACAAATGCDFLVTGNKKDLLDLEKHGRTSIVNPAQFVEILKA